MSLARARLPLAAPSLKAAEYPMYKSPYGPKYFYQPQVYGITTKAVVTNGIKAGFFGGVALFAVVFFASGIPRIQDDILKKVPFIGQHYVKDIPASDNPF